MITDISSIGSFHSFHRRSSSIDTFDCSQQQRHDKLKEFSNQFCVKNVHFFSHCYLGFIETNLIQSNVLNETIEVYNFRSILFFFWRKYARLKDIE